MKLRKYLIVVVSPEEEEKLSGKIEEALDSQLDMTGGVDVYDLFLLTEEEVDLPAPPDGTTREGSDAFDEWRADAEAVVSDAGPTTRTG